jgi:hypothetical protein
MSTDTSLITAANVTSADIKREGFVPTRDGDVKVHSITLAGVIECITIISESDLKMPQSLQYRSLESGIDWAAQHFTDPQSLKVDLAGAQSFVAELIEAQQQEIIKWLLMVPKLSPVLLQHLTKKSAEEVAGLALPDVILIVAKGLELLDVTTTLGLAQGFFTDLGGLTDIVNMFQGHGPKSDIKEEAEAETEKPGASPATSTGPSD